MAPAVSNSFLTALAAPTAAPTTGAANAVAPTAAVPTVTAANIVYGPLANAAQIGNMNPRGLCCVDELGRIFPPFSRSYYIGQVYANQTMDLFAAPFPLVTQGYNGTKAAMPNQCYPFIWLTQTNPDIDAVLIKSLVAVQAMQGSPLMVDPSTLNVYMNLTQVGTLTTAGIVFSLVTTPTVPTTTSLKPIINPILSPGAAADPQLIEIFQVADWLNHEIVAPTPNVLDTASWLRLIPSTGTVVNFATGSIIGSYDGTKFTSTPSAPLSLQSLKLIDSSIPYMGPIPSKPTVSFTAEMAALQRAIGMIAMSRLLGKSQCGLNSENIFVDIDGSSIGSLMSGTYVPDNQLNVISPGSYANISSQFLYTWHVDPAAVTRAKLDSLMAIDPSVVSKFPVGQGTVRVEIPLPDPAPVAPISLVPPVVPSNSWHSAGYAVFGIIILAIITGVVLYRGSMTKTDVKLKNMKAIPDNFDMMDIDAF